MKRIVSLQDISCIGKCSLTVALPVLSSMGIETAILPTAVLSTHTMFRDPVFIDLTDYISPIAEHWKREGFTFDAIYTGYLGSVRQIDLVRNFIDDFSRTEHSLVLVDPVMADNGTLYSGFNQNFVTEMKRLCEKADIIVPNITEASFLTGIPYRETQDLAYLEELLNALSGLGPSKVILTGVSLTPDRLGIMGKDCSSGAFFTCDAPKQNKSYHGTGDLFASTLLGCLVNEKSLENSLQIACDYVSRTIGATIDDPDSRTYGVNFESTLPFLQ